MSSNTLGTHTPSLRVQMLAAWYGDGVFFTASRDGGKTWSPPPFAGGAALGDYNGTASINNGVYVTTFSPAGGYLTAARIEFPPAVRRRGANH